MDLELRRTSLRDRVPTAFWWALLPALAGFLVHLQTIDTRTVNGESSCDYVDYARIASAIALAVLAVAGVVQDRRKPHREWRIGTPLALVVAAALLVLAGYHLLVGLGLVGGPCN